MAYWTQIMDLKNLQQILLEDNNEAKLALFLRNHISNAERNTRKFMKSGINFHWISQAKLKN